MSEIYIYFLTDKYIKPTRLTDRYMRNLRLRIVYCYGQRAKDKGPADVSGMEFRDSKCKVESATIAMGVQLIRQPRGPNVHLSGGPYLCPLYVS